jgi:hypothetical protein
MSFLRIGILSSAMLLAATVATAADNWTIESQKRVSAVSWNAEIYIKCTGSRNRGETFKILVMDSGGYESVTGPREKTLEKVANFHCS